MYLIKIKEVMVPYMIDNLSYMRCVSLELNDWILFCLWKT